MSARFQVKGKTVFEKKPRRWLSRGGEPDLCAALVSIADAIQTHLSWHEECGWLIDGSKVTIRIEVTL